MLRATRQPANPKSTARGIGSRRHWLTIAARGTIALAVFAAAGPAVYAQRTALRLTLPPTFYAVPGIEMSIYFANTVLAAPAEELTFSVTCAVGQSQANRWTLNATPAQVGQHPWVLNVCDKSGRTVAQGATQVCVVPPDAGRERDIALLIVGDSLTHASAYPNEVARLLAQPGNPQWQMLGTHKPAAVAANVAHEGYGGWTWRAFNTKFTPGSPTPGKTTSSPFVFAAGEKQTPTLDVGRYIAERCHGRTPDFVTFLLGINDCFGLKADDPKGLDAGIDGVFQEADTLLAAFHQAAPRAALGVCLTTPPNIRDGAFEANYKGRYPRWNWRQVQHRIVERQLEHFGGRERAGVFVVPTELNLDVVGGYPENNGVHPNKVGYEQIGASLYAWIKARLATQEEANKPR